MDRAGLACLTCSGVSWIDGCRNGACISGSRSCSAEIASADFTRSFGKSFS